MNILIPGQYPRSENLITATREFDRQRQSATDVLNAIQDDVIALKSLQWGLPYLTTGLFNWQDLVRPFVELVKDARAESIKRFYETNSFWRLLEVPEKFVLKSIDHQAWFKKYFLADGAFQKDDPIIINLPFPFLFREYSKNLTLDQISSLLESTFQMVRECPNAVVCLIEPSFGWQPLNDPDKQMAKLFTEKLRKSIPNTIFLCTFFFPVESDIDFIYELPVDGYGIDFYNNSISKMLKRFPANKTLLAGVLNTQSTLIESSKNISQFIDMLHAVIPLQQILFTPNGPAELLPRNIMDKKVKNLLQEVIACLPHPL